MGSKKGDMQHQKHRGCSLQCDYDTMIGVVANMHETGVTPSCFSICFFRSISYDALPKSFASLDEKHASDAIGIFSNIVRRDEIEDDYQ